MSSPRDRDASAAPDSEWVALGVVTRPHGVRGELRVHAFNADSELLASLRTVHLRDAAGALREYKVRSARRAPKTWLMFLAGIDTVEAAETLRDQELCIAREHMPPPDPDEFYLRDAIGLPVKRAGEIIGEVLEVMLYPSMECFRCRFEDGIREVPVMRPWVEGVDVEAGEVRVGDLDDLPVEKLGGLMRYEVVTLFPELFAAADVGILGKARERGDVSLTLLSPREFATDKHRSVDDYPYGGGSGMVLMPAPVVDALEHLDQARGGPTRRILLTPQGAPFTQRTAERLAAQPALTLVCGRYEGFDERIRRHVDEEISLGDFVLLGGEIAALAIIEATARLLPGVLGNERSATDESHASFLLEYPQYTRPPEFRGQGIPDILMSGHHAKIEAWRRRESVKRTLQRRPDLLEGRELDGELTKLVASVRAELAAEEVTRSEDRGGGVDPTAKPGASGDQP